MKREREFLEGWRQNKNRRERQLKGTKRKRAYERGYRRKNSGGKARIEDKPKTAKRKGSKKEKRRLKSGTGVTGEAEKSLGFARR